MKILDSMKMNWQTTAAGIFAGLLGGQAAGYTHPDGRVNWLAVLIALAGAIFGAVAKSHDVTGGTIPATKEAETRTTAAKAAPSTK